MERKGAHKQKNTTRVPRLLALCGVMKSRHKTASPVAGVRRPLFLLGYLSTSDIVCIASPLPVPCVSLGICSKHIADAFLFFFPHVNRERKGDFDYPIPQALPEVQLR